MKDGMGAQSRHWRHLPAGDRRPLVARCTAGGMPARAWACPEQVPQGARAPLQPAHVVVVSCPPGASPLAIHPSNSSGSSSARAR